MLETTLQKWQNMLFMVEQQLSASVIFKKVLTYRKLLKSHCIFTLVMILEILIYEAFSLTSFYYKLWTQNTQGFCTTNVVVCFSFIFDPHSGPFPFTFHRSIYFLFCAKMRHLTRNIQIYAPAHGKESAYYLWNLDQTLPDCLQHFVRLSMSPVIWHRFFSSWKAFPSLCLVCQLPSSDWQSRLTLHWSSPPSPCQGNRWNERNRNQ